MKILALLTLLLGLHLGLGLDPNHAQLGPEMDPNGAELGPALDPNG